MKEYQITLINEAMKMKEYFRHSAQLYKFRSNSFKTLTKMRDECEKVIAHIVTSDLLLDYVEEGEDATQLSVLWTALQKDYGCGCFADCKEEDINTIALTCLDTCCYEDEECEGCVKHKKFVALMFAQWANAHQYKALKKMEQIQTLIGDVHDLLEEGSIGIAGCPGKRGGGICGDDCAMYDCVYYLSSAIENAEEDLRNLVVSIN